MRIRDLLSRESIQLMGNPADKTQALNQMVDLMAKSGNINDVETYRKGVFKREEESTTGIGMGIAIPHCKSDAVTKPGLAAMVVKSGVEFASLDGAPVNIIFLIAAPNTEDNVHLQVLSKLSMMLIDESFLKKLVNATSVDEFLAVIDAEEEARDEKDKAKVSGNTSESASASANSASKGIEILAVTGCPTGIAHTYMAAEALEKTAAEMGVTIKVETRGSGGAKNVLTDEEIRNAKAIIVAADTKVPMDRFNGKKLIECRVADGINKSRELIQRGLDGNAPVYSSSNASSSSSSSETANSGSIGHQIYTHLMNGVSHMLPFVIGGGILIALAFLVDTICGYGASGGGNFGNCTPLAAFLKYVGGLSMGLMVPVLAGYIAASIADRPGLAVGFTGGLLASSGNALLFGSSGPNFIFSESTDLGAFQTFIRDFAFQGANSGATVSGFLGGIVAGFLAGYIVLLLKKICEKLPDALDGIKPTLIYPLVGIFLMGVLMCFIFNPIIGVINTGLSNMLSALADANMLPLLGLILGAMMAIDMGGPINKAAYVFGTGMLATAQSMVDAGAAVSDPKVQACYIAMAAIMAGGMVPPVGIALACKLFPGKFTKEEQSSWVSNIVMGCSFITEGAIPFAAADPGRVIPCTMVGAGVAGCLTAVFKCTLMAPHGGVFVFATIGNPLLYILAWLAGSAVTCVMLGVLKKKK